MKIVQKKLITRKDEITRDFLQLMNAHIEAMLAGKQTKRLHTKDFAEMLFIHPRHLTNTLKENTGKSPCDFLEERFLEEGQKMLLETNLPVAEIGYRFGFDDPTNFTKFFKGLAGVTPLQYRKQNK